MSEQKHKSDLVKVVNITKDGTSEPTKETPAGNKYFTEDVVFAYNGSHYTVPAGKYITVIREVAEHGVKKAYSFANRIQRLQIEELPENQRNIQNLGANDSQALIEQIEKLKAENEALKLKAEKEPEPEPYSEYEKKKPGRPKGS